MRTVVLVLAGWTGSTAVVAGLFVALVRGSGGTDCAPLPAAAPLPVHVPQMRGADEARTPARA